MSVTFNSMKSIQSTVFVNELEITAVELIFPASGGELAVVVNWEEGNTENGVFTPATSHRRKFTLDDNVADILNAPLPGNTTAFEGIVEAVEAMLSGSSSIPPGASSRRAFPVKP